jgi:hypothetical protein
MALGRKSIDKGWTEGIHYVNASPNSSKKAIIRIPWNKLIQSFAKNKKMENNDYRKKSAPMYKSTTVGKLE